MSGRALIHNLRYQIGVAAAVIGLCAVATPALAASNNHPVTLPKDQTVNHDYFAAGSTVEVDGTVNGDVYAAGGQVIINGTVNGDVLAAGGTVTIDGTVNGSVRAAGGSLVVDGHVTKNASITGGSIQVARNATIDGNFVAAGGSILDSGSVTGDANVATGMLTLGSDAHVGGALTYWSNQEAIIANGTVAGSVTHRIPPARPHQQSHNWFAGALLGALYWLVVTYILAVLVMLWLPRHSGAVTETIRRRPWQSLGWGVVAAILVPIIGVVLLITLIGAPLGLALWALYAVPLLLAPVWFIMAGREMLSTQLSRENTYVVLLLAAFIYAVISLIPIVGSLFVIITGLIGLGASATTGYGFYRHLRQRNEL